MELGVTKHAVIIQNAVKAAGKRGRLSGAPGWDYNNKKIKLCRRGAMQIPIARPRNMPDAVVAILFYNKKIKSYRQCVMQIPIARPRNMPDAVVAILFYTIK